MKKEIRLNNPSMAPSGQAVRQNGRLMTMEKYIIPARIPTLNQNHQPAMSKIALLLPKISGEPKCVSNHASANIGIPASMVPAGQIVQKNGSFKIGGRIRTNTTREAYFPYPAHRGKR